MNEILSTENGAQEDFYTEMFQSHDASMTSPVYLPTFTINISHSCTLPETHVAPENRPSQKETSSPTIHLQVRKC